MKNLFALIFTIFTFACATAQELNAKVTVNAGKVGSNVNKNAFKTLEAALNNFLNNRKWSSVNIKPNEKINCNFLLIIESTETPNVYKGSLTVQSARPVFNSSYNSPIINFKDDDLLFKYVEFQQIDFNDNRVAGNDASVSNLPAILAYYAYMILGFDFDSFSLNGGNPYFLKAQNVVNNAPDTKGISGWKPFDGNRNRYWLAENLLNPKYAQIHTFYYSYYRNGLDQIYDNVDNARTNMVNMLQQFDEFNTINPNTMIQQFFFQGKSAELIQFFSKAAPQQRIQARDILSRIDLTNSNKYSNDLK